MRTGRGREKKKYFRTMRINCVNGPEEIGFELFLFSKVIICCFIQKAPISLGAYANEILMDFITNATKWGRQCVNRNSIASFKDETKGKIGEWISFR